MIQFRHDRASQVLPAPISYFSSQQKGGRKPGLPGGNGVGIPVPALLRDIERTLIAHDIAATRFGIIAANDPGLVHRLRKKASVTPAMRDRLLAFIRSLDSGEA